MRPERYRPKRREVKDVEQDNKPEPSAPKPPRDLQPHILAALVVDAEVGAQLVGLIERDTFDGVARDLAEPLLSYWRRHQRPPGVEQFEAVLGQTLLAREPACVLAIEVEHNARDTNFNGRWVLDQLTTWQARQRLKSALMEATDLYGQLEKTDPDALVTKARAVLETVLRETAPIETGNATGVMNIDHVCSLSLAEPDLLIDPWLETGDVAMIHAPPGQAKTLLMLTLGWCLAIGGGGIGDRWDVKRRARVLYVDGELPLNRLQRRLRRFLAKRMPRDFHILSRRGARAEGIEYPSLYSSAGRAKLDRAIEETQAEVVILDSIFTLFGAITEKEADRWVQVADWLAGHQDAGRSFVLIHHDSKGGTGNAYGTVLRSVFVDTQIGLLPYNEDELHEDGEARKVVFHKHRDFGADAAAPFLIRLKVEDEGYAWTTEPAPEGGGGGRPGVDASAIIALVEGGKKQKEVADIFEVSPGRVSQIMREHRERTERAAGDLLKEEPKADAPDKDAKV